MFKIADVIKLLTRIFVKQNKRFPKGLESVDIRITAKEIFDVGKSQGYKGGISENQLKHFLAWKKQAKPIETTVKKGEVFDLTGKKIDTSKPILGGKNVELTHNEKIDWLVKNVSPTAEQTIPPKATLEAMLKDGREDLIDHFFEMHTKKLSGKPQINIDTSDLKHPELVKKMMMDEKLKPILVKTEAQIKTKLEGMNKKTVERIRRRRYEAALKAEREKMAKDSEYIPEILDPDDFAYGGIAGMLGEPTYADGGRTGFAGGKLAFDAARRAFLKMVGAGAAGVGVVKSGLFGLLKGSKPAAGVAEATSAIVRDADGIPNYVYDLIKVVQNKGKKEIIPGFKRSDLGTKHSYKGVEVTEEAGGNIIIKKGKEIPSTHPDHPSYKEVEMEIQKGGTSVKDEGLETAKIVKEPDEIIEATARPDMDGKMKDVDFFIDDADHLDLKKIADEAIIKKASGGRVPLGEGGIGDTEIAADIDKSLNQLMEDFKLYKDYGGKKI